MDLALYSGEGWSAYRATDDDDAALCALAREVRLKGGLDMAQERDPRFFALLQCHAATHHVTIVKDDLGGAQACGSMVLRDGYLFGEKRKVAYLCDLRIRPEFTGRRVLSTAYTKTLEHAIIQGADAAYIVVIGSNDRMNGITASGHTGMPLHLPHCAFDMMSWQLTRTRMMRSSVQNASDKDLDELCAFLDAGHKRRQFGYVDMYAVLQARLLAWPGFSLDNFLLSRDGRGRIRGCLALWDSSPVKRTRIMGYGGSFRWIKRGSDLIAPLAGFKRLPAPGDLLRYQYATHLEIADDDPMVLREMLMAASARLDRREWHFISAMVPVGSKLAQAFTGPFVQRTRMQLHALVPQGSPLKTKSFVSDRPGFEMALN